MKKPQQYLLFFLVVCLSMTFLPAQATMLYDASSGSVGPNGRTPDQQGWTTPASAVYSEAEGILYYDSTNGGGSFQSTGHPLLGTLDRQLGFAIEFDLMITAESIGYSIDEAPLAGFGLMVIADDVGAGIQMGFMRSGVYIYNGNPAAPSETILQDNSDHIVDYKLNVLGNNYQLTADGNSIYSGTVENLMHPIYGAMSNYIHFGDDNGASSAIWQMTYVSIVPEPCTMWMMAICGTAILHRKES